MPAAGATQPAVLIRLRPTGPWRYGPGDGAYDRVDSVYRSDRLYSAVTVAMQQLGQLNEWLDATARTERPAIVFSSLYPYQADTLFATPPSSVWPPPASQLTAPNPAFLSKIRWNAVQLVPLSVIETLLSGRSIPAEQWTADPATGCLLRRDRPGSAPFRVTLRTAGAVDRITRGAIEVSAAACVEFEPDAGLWTVGRYRDAAAASAWQDRLRACFRLLADSGFGGRRTHGWGKTEEPDFKRGSWPGIILPKLGRGAEGDNNGSGGESSLFWLLSLYSPSKTDAIDWAGGDYRLTLRGGRVDSAGSTGLLKKNARMVAEGSVLAAQQEPMGAAIDVAPDNFTHPVYRSGFALTLRLPVVKAAIDFTPVETPVDDEAVEPQAGGEEEQSVSVPVLEQSVEPEEVTAPAPSLEEPVDASDEHPTPLGVLGDDAAVPEEAAPGELAAEIAPVEEVTDEIAREEVADEIATEPARTVDEVEGPAESGEASEVTGQPLEDPLELAQPAAEKEPDEL